MALKKSSDGKDLKEVCRYDFMLSQGQTLFVEGSRNWEFTRGSLKAI